MAQSMFGGMTSYKDQSLSDIQQDINKWQAYTNEIQNFFNETIDKLEKMNYMTKMDFNMSSVFYNTIQITNTFLEDFRVINESIGSGNITEKDVKLLNNIGRISIINNKDYGVNFKSGDWHEYEKTDSNSDFRLAEKLYENGRDFFVTLQDAVNAANRLNDYINTSPPPTGNSYYIYGTNHNIMQGQSGNTTMNINQNNPENTEQVKILLNQITENIDEYFNDEQIKIKIKEYVEVLQIEVQEEKPRKSMIKLALEGLQVFNQSAKFIATVAEITEKLGYL